MNEFDEDLTRDFSRMRTRDAARAPAFGRVLQGRAPRRRVRRRAVPLVACALALVAVLVVRQTRLGSDASTLGAQALPTDFLLDLAGGIRATDIPQIGSTEVFALPPQQPTSTVGDSGSQPL